MDKDWDKIRERIIGIYNVLIETGSVENLKELAIRCKYQEKSLNEIIEGKRQIPVYLIKNIISVYNVNPGYIYTGKGKRFIDTSNIVKPGTKTIVSGNSKNTKTPKKNNNKSN